MMRPELAHAVPIVLLLVGVDLLAPGFSITLRQAQGSGITGLRFPGLASLRAWATISHPPSGGLDGNGGRWTAAVNIQSAAADPMFPPGGSPTSERRRASRPFGRE